MDSNGQTSASGLAASAPRPAARGVLIAVAFYRNEQLVAPLLDALIRAAADIKSIGGSVVLYNDSPDYPALAEALQANVKRAEAAFACRLVSNASNMGFVRTMNLAVAAAVAGGDNLLLLNSDTEVEPGALVEMARVLALDHMIGFVNPRSNNATLATLPLHLPDGWGAGRAEASRKYRALAAMLPPVSYAPTAVGFCLLIAWRVLAELGGLDEIYGKGYNEENDLVMRAGRCGFRAVLANHAFVWHEGETSFATAEISRDVWEPTNRAILDQRYPEYGAYTTWFYDAPETIAEHLLAKLIPDSEGKLDIAFDFSSFRAAHNGTFQAGRQLLAVATQVWGPRYRLHVLCADDVFRFHDYAALGVAFAATHAANRFAAIFRVGQPYDWNVLQRLVVKAPVLGVYMLDTISIDCPQLTSPLLYNMWQFTLDHFDLVATQSRQTAAQFAARFSTDGSAAQLVSWHSMDLADYQLPGTGDGLAPSRDAAVPARILVLGNHFHHKYLAPTANALAAAFPGRQIVALGGAIPLPKHQPNPSAAPVLDRLPNLAGIPVGPLTDAEIGAEYAACDAVVFPSHAEGFGFPALNALAARRPLFLRRLPVFEEMFQALGEPPNMYFYDTTAQLIALMATLPAWIEWPRPPAGNGAERSAQEIKAALEAAMAQASYHRIVRRLRGVQLPSSLSYTAPPGAVIDTKPAQAARFIAERVEIGLRRVLAIGLVYRVMQAVFRGARGFRRD